MAWFHVYTYTIDSWTMMDISKKLRYSISAESPPFFNTGAYALVTATHSFFICQYVGAILPFLGQVRAEIYALRS